MTPPPMPPWSGMHVLLVHFPIALLIVAPLLMFIAMFFQKKFPGMAFIACLVLFLGTIAAWVTMKTGGAAFEEAATDNQAGQALMHEHQEMGEKVPWMFTGLFVAYLLVLLLPLMIKRLKPVTVRIFGTLLILVPYAFAAIYLSNTAHKGGLLVHFYGIHADTAESVVAEKAAEAAQNAPAPPAPAPGPEATTHPT